QVHRRFPQARLLLVGDGPLRGDAEAQARESVVGGAIRFLGARADVENILPALDVFTMASATEGMSNAILEAQAGGVAAFATAVGGNPELWQREATGWPVPPLHPDALARALESLIGEPERRAGIGSAAQHRVQREFSTQAMVAAYQSLYRELAHAG